MPPKAKHMAARAARGPYAEGTRDRQDSPSAREKGSGYVAGPKLDASREGGHRRTG